MNLNPITMQLVADKYIRLALEEDIHSEDVSTNAVMPEYRAGEVELICKQDGVIAGLPVFERVFTMLDADTKVEWAQNQGGTQVKDGDLVKKGQLLATVKGDVRVLLSGERTALNYLQRLSGIATYTHEVAQLLEGSSTTLLDTRKTTPCMRIFEKYAVCVGGGQNHRYNLSDGVLLKDNHIDAAGGVKDEGIHQFNKQGQKAVKTTQENIGKAKDKITDFKQSRAVKAAEQKAAQNMSEQHGLQIRHGAASRSTASDVSQTAKSQLIKTRQQGQKMIKTTARNAEKALEK